MDYPYGLGSYSRKITTRSADAQRWFDRGLNWCFGYHHQEAGQCFAKALEFDTTAITAVIAMRAKDKTARMEFEAIVEAYRHALGIEGPDFVIPLPPPSIPPPPPPKRITAREKQAREALLLADASRMAEASIGGAGAML